TWHGAALNDAARHALVIRHIAPDGQTTEHVRGLFDSTADVGNLSPDVEVDIYAIWFGAGLVGPSYLRIESDLADLEDGTGETADYLRLRAVELAVESDNAAWRMFEDAGEEGIVSYDTMRVIIAAQERQSADDSGPVVPSLDLLANTRRIYGHDDPISMQIALGLTDAMTEGMVLERATGLPAMTVPQIFASHFQEESNDLASRLEFFEDALQRLWEEGVTEEGLTLLDPQSDAEATVWLIGTELLLALTDEQAAILEAAAGEAWDGLESTIDGLVLDTGSDRAWPIELLLLQSGASLDYVPQIRHVESPQVALATPSGSFVEGTGTYLDESFAIHAIARMFEEAEDPSDPESKRDVADWHLTDDAGTIIGSGTSDEDTATLSESKPRILQFGEDDQTSSFYLSSLWMAPAVAAGVRAGTPTDCWFAYQTGGAAEWVKTELTQFTHEKRTLRIDGQSVDVAVIVAGDEDATHSVTIARYGLSRLVLALTTPAGESQIASIVTPRELRLRGRVMSWRGSADARSQQAHAIGVADAELFGSSDIGTSWPDGTVDLHVPESANPTLAGSIAILVDTSNSMEQPADPACTGDSCMSKIDVVAGALAAIIQNTPEDIELAIWGFESSFDSECAEQIRERAPWSLDRDRTLDALQYFDEVYLTGGTPLTGAVQAALDEMGDASWGASRRLIVLADGDNDCDTGLADVTIPANIQIHTIGVGLMEGSDAEQQLTDLASRARGTYTRTTNGEDLSDSLTTIGALPLPDPERPEDVPVTITAANHLATEVDWPVDSDDMIIYLDEDPDRTDLPGLVTIQPGESFPSADVDLTDFAVARIEECRSRRPEVLIIVPDRMVDIGLTEGTLGWLEIDPETGYTTAVTLDGLHGSSPVGTHGAIIAGMWSGVNSVMGGFSSCVVDYSEDGTGSGCGSSAAEITASICGSIQGDAGTWMTYLGSALGGIAGLSNFNYFFQAGASTVEVVCNSGLPGSTLAQVDFSLNTLGHGISQLCGVLTSNAATLHSWAVCYLVGVGSDIAG
ncbi:MAG: VWA domain-containing protein, partial [Planctomycetes bacterium]|nr:VWA domain-containing protein [Planctomycetota bacterium]